MLAVSAVEASAVRGLDPRQTQPGRLYFYKVCRSFDDCGMGRVRRSMGEAFCCGIISGMVSTWCAVPLLT
jgi:hypothetical protein